MASPVYSKPLFSLNPVPVGVSAAYTVPGGFAAVVRSVVAFNASAWWTPIQGITLSLASTTAIISSWRTPYVRAVRMYVADLHQVALAGDQLDIQTNDLNWSIFVSGYQLTLP